MVTPDACDGRPGRIAIVGMGPRGLLVLERLLTLASAEPRLPVRIAVFEPGEPGVGVHVRGQPGYLMLNTVASQLSVFPDLPSVACGPARPGPSLYDWCRSRDIRLDSRGQPCGTLDGRRVEQGDFLPRSLLGDYLHWSFERITADLPAHVSLVVHREAAVACRREIPDGGWVLEGAKGTREQADALFLTTGHGSAAPAAPMPAAALRPYPLPQVLAAVGAQGSVAIAGLGLCAMDAIAALTAGRGGRVREAGGALVYEPSGREPRILLFSRCGRPFHARPGRFDPGWQRAQPTFLTAAAVEDLRARAPGGRLDFEQQVLPLMKDEMRAAYYRGCARLGGGAAQARVEGMLLSARSPAARVHAFDSLRQLHGPYDPDEALQTGPVALPARAYAAWVREWIARDLRESRKGLAGSPTKAALEVWRDLRDSLRRIVAHDGLTPASRARFFRAYAPLANRLVGGPQMERHEELLALIDAGVVQVLPPAHAAFEEGRWRLRPREAGQPEVEVQHLVQARVEASGLRGGASPLLSRMHGDGTLRAFDDLGAVEVDAEGHPLDAEGRLLDNAWVFGPATEGTTYYNHYVASGGGYCRASHEAQRAAAGCLALLAGREELAWKR
jgi:uncharacterized NAD(P)/FAD-binding protein YdhS